MKPTEAERRMGRYMRSPDGHDGGDGGAAAGSEGGAGGDAAGQGDGAGEGGDAGDTSVLGGAKSGDGAGDEGKDGDAAGDGGKADDGGDGAEGAGPPEVYDLKLTSIAKDDDGKDVETSVDMDKVLVEKASPVLKDLKLSNEQANKLVALVPEVQARLVEQQTEAHGLMKAQWAKDAEADKEIGGKNWADTQRLAAKALDHYGAVEGSEFRKLLDDTGLGNHPVMISMFRKIGLAVKEDDKLERDTTNPQGKKDRLETLYPDDVPKKQGS